MKRKYFFKRKGKFIMKLLKRLSAIGLAIALSTSLSVNALAATKTALCVGVNFESDLSTNTGNYKTNASNAKQAYSKISGMTAT